MTTVSSVRDSFLKPLAVRGAVFAQDDFWVWCGSAIRGEDGRYHLFASRWPRAVPFHPGWLTNSEVVRAVADGPEGPYTFAEVVLPARGAEFWDGRATHNPVICRCGTRYLLYYVGMTHPFPDVVTGEDLRMADPRVIASRASKRIGLAVADRVTGPWSRLDVPILAPRPRTFYSYLVSNPAPWVEPDGAVLLVFKCRAYRGHAYGGMRLGVARAKRFSGPYEVVSQAPIFSSETNGEVEDPFLWRQEGRYHLLAKDMSGRLCGEAGAGVHALSSDGLEWKLGEVPLAYPRQLQWEHGETRSIAHMERPFLLIEDGKPTHLFAAVAEGEPHFRNLKRTWNQAFRLV